MEATATAKFMRVSPRKARLVVDLIRGKKISEARTILALANKAAAATVKKSSIRRSPTPGRPA